MIKFKKQLNLNSLNLKISSISLNINNSLDLNSIAKYLYDNFHAQNIAKKLDQLLYTHTSLII